MNTPFRFAVSAPPPSIDLPIARYRLLGELGRGASSVVYRASDGRASGREVALKVIRKKEPLSAEDRAAYEQEIRLLTELGHPCLVRGLDHGEIDERSLYLVMELVEGQELTSMLGEPLPVPLVTVLLAQLLHALAALHARGFAHRDVCPRNLRVRPGGALVLLDLGLVAPLGSPTTGNLNGTFGYLAPEQRKPGALSAASDLYSVGCIGYELIAGRPAFSGSTLQVVMAHELQTPPALGKRRSDLPPALDAFVMRLMAKEPAARPAGVKEALAELGPLLPG